MAEVWLDDIDASACDDVLESPPGEVSFASRNGGDDVSSQVLEDLEVFNEDWFFDEEQVEWLEFLHQDSCHRLVDASVEVDRDAEVLPQDLPNGIDSSDGIVDFLV